MICHVKIERHWFDLSSYLNHPGGIQILKKFHLRDATDHQEGYVQHMLENTEIRDPDLQKSLEERQFLEQTKKTHHHRQIRHDK
jgi:cytochrome b involved in lipid metabolism